MSEENIELLPCPFCGVVPIIRTTAHDIEKWNIICVNTICMLYPKTPPLDGKEKAIDVWNHRPGAVDDWTPVAEGSMPEFDKPVMAIPKGRPDKIDAAILRYEDGWHWESHNGMGYLTDLSSYEFDDDYEYTHWRYFPSTDISKEKK